MVSARIALRSARRFRLHPAPCAAVLVRRRRNQDESHSEEARRRPPADRRRCLDGRGEQRAQQRAPRVRPADGHAPREGQDGGPGRRGAHGLQGFGLGRHEPGGRGPRAVRHRQGRRHPRVPAAARAQDGAQARPDVPVRPAPHAEAGLRADVLRAGLHHHPGGVDRRAPGGRADQPGCRALRRVRGRRPAPRAQGR